MIEIDISKFFRWGMLVEGKRDKLPQEYHVQSLSLTDIKAPVSEKAWKLLQ